MNENTRTYTVGLVGADVSSVTLAASDGRTARDLALVNVPLATATTFVALRCDRDKVHDLREVTYGGHSRFAECRHCGYRRPFNV